MHLSPGAACSRKYVCCSNTQGRSDRLIRQRTDNKRISLERNIDAKIVEVSAVRRTHPRLELPSVSDVTKDEYGPGLRGRVGGCRSGCNNDSVAADVDIAAHLAADLQGDLTQFRLLCPRRSRPHKNVSRPKREIIRWSVSGGTQHNPVTVDSYSTAEIRSAHCVCDNDLLLKAPHSVCSHKNVGGSLLTKRSGTFRHTNDKRIA